MMYYEYCLSYNKMATLLGSFKMATYILREIQLNFNIVISTNVCLYNHFILIVKKIIKEYAGAAHRNKTYPKTKQKRPPRGSLSQSISISV